MKRITGGTWFIDKIWVENVEFVALDDLWRWVVKVVVGLVVFVPLEPQFHTVKVVGFTGFVFVDPGVLLAFFRISYLMSI